MAILTIGEELTKNNPDLFEEMKGLFAGEFEEIENIGVRGIRLYKVDHPEFADDEFCCCKFSLVNQEIHAVEILNKMNVRTGNEHISN